jgi:uncharacterized protein
VADFEPGEHKLWFRGAENAQGGFIDIPVMVTKSATDGPVMFLQSSLHGDELAGTQVIQQVFREIEYTNMNGTIVWHHWIKSDGYPVAFALRLLYQRWR